MGFFITLEGVDGSGKSTQARNLADRLRASGRDVVLTREPGGSPGAEEIRRLLVEGDPGRWSAETEILLFTAARRDHVERVINPSRANDTVVICDRFLDSTRAYQGDGELRRLVDQLHELMIGVMPDLTLIFDLDPTEGLQRAGARASDETRFEAKGLAFQHLLRQRFKQIANEDPGRCRVIDASGSVEGVADSIWEATMGALEEAHG